MEVDLFQCSRCKVVWADTDGTVPFKCPRCWQWSGLAPEMVVMGRDVRVRVIREYGLEAGLLDPKVRRGLERLDLGQCEHGYLTPHICPECCNISS